MSIASEITALNTNLTAAKDAVVDKGGAVGDTGLAGLATEIASIPSGGEPIPPYGQIEYYWDVRDVYLAEGDGCTVTIDDADAYAAFFEEAFASTGTTGDLQYQDGEWIYYDWEDPDDPEKTVDLATIGLSVVFDDPSDPYGYIMCSKAREIHEESGLAGVSVDTAAALDGLTQTDSDGNYDVDGTSIYPNSIRKYSFGPSVTTVPTGFLYYTANGEARFEETDYTNATNVTSIGDSVVLKGKSSAVFPSLLSIGNSVTIYASYFAAPKLLTIGTYFSLPFVSEVMLPKVTSIGAYFRAGKAINIGLESVETIGQNFAADYATWIYLPKIRTIGNYFLSNSKATSVKMSFIQGFSQGQPVSDLTTIGSTFMQSAACSTIELATDEPSGSDTGGYGFLIPQTVTSIGSSFMRDCSNFAGIITVYCPASVFGTSTTFDYLMLISDWTGTQSASCTDPIYTKGFRLKGSQKNSWATRFPTMAKTQISTGRYASRTTIMA